MSDASDGRDPKPKPEPGERERRSIWIQRSLGSIGILIVLVVSFLASEQHFLRTMKEANTWVADAIGHATPERLTAAFAQRRAQCDYRWLVVCEKRPVECLLPPSLCNDGLARTTWEGDWSILGAAWMLLREVATLPDVAWHVLATSYEEGALTLLMTLIFVGINSAVAFLVLMRVPGLLLIAPPVTVVLSSWLYWLVQHVFILASDGAGLVLELLLLVAFLPEGVRLLLGWLRTGHDIKGIAHKAAEVKDLLRKIR